MKPIIGTSHQDCEAQFKLAVLKKEAWIRNVMKVFGYTQEQAEAAWDRIQENKLNNEEDNRNQSQGH